MSMEEIYTKANLEMGNMKEREFIIIMKMIRHEGIDMKGNLVKVKRMEKEFIIKAIMIDMKAIGKRI